MDNYVGKRLDGRYEVQEIIGVGGMSVVYRAYDNVDDRIVAVKILKDEFAANEEFKRRFKNESKAIALLSHPNIVKVYDVNFGEKLQYIVMEYIDGITLKEYINKQGAITWNDALFFMTQILKAVQHAHDKGIVHRDIKPQNIILLSNGEIKVTDFGIARFSRSDTKTLTEQAIGSVHYIAPEQAKGETTDERADIYSLGVVLYEMLAGTVPFEADSAVSVALMQLQADAKRLTDINADIPLGLEQICVHAMQKDALDRYQTATEMLLDIEEIIKNPNVTFNYATKTDSNPTKVVNTGKIAQAAQPEPEYDDEDEEEYADPDRKKKIVTASVIGLILLAAAMVLLIMFVTNNVSKATVKLENFVGASYDEIINSKAYDYEFVQETKKTEDQTPGIVLEQKPEAGTKVQKGSTVTLVVAVSADDIEVPNVYNLTESQAKDQLEKSKLTSYKVLSMSSETVEDGRVVYTEPKAGTVVSSSTEITIYLSTGPSTTVIKSLKVPDVYGLTQSGARAFLEKYGFKNVSFVTEDSAFPKGTVLSQEPAAGTVAQETDSIKVVISSGVTTTTTEKAVQVSIAVRLPKCVDENGDYVTDTLRVKVDGETYKNQKVTLNGTSQYISVTGESKKEQTIIVSLSGAGATDSISSDGKSDKSEKIDFSKFSYNKETTVTKAEEKTETASEKDNKDSKDKNKDKDTKTP
ncbi:MAG: Stk1 family PASTA domain-containing Ser/Thr kinase [Eubacterium sp.]|nr:Stk1 family PASTA domain-containing Ser/Thr kinase [Eubacterium sp.]MBR0412991.1 Stk1 family PASTA domain-containing Ser/Thr kinase [Eubacterium sp.]